MENKWDALGECDTTFLRLIDNVGIIAMMLILIVCGTLFGW